jgi:hypothetical protein
MISACTVNGKGFNAYDYKTRAINNGFTHEVASSHLGAKSAYSVSGIHDSTSIIGDHNDGIFNLFVGDFSISTGTFPKYFIASNIYMNDLNYIEGTVLIIAVAREAPYNIEIHATAQATGTTYLPTNIKTGVFTGLIS